MARQVIHVPEGVYYQLMNLRWKRISGALQPHFYILWAFGLLCSIAVDILTAVHQSKQLIWYVGLTEMIAYALALPFFVILMLSYQRRNHWLNKSIEFQGSLAEEAKRRLDEAKRKK